MILYPQIIAPYVRYLGTARAASAAGSTIAQLLAGEKRRAAAALTAIVDSGTGDAHALGALGFIAYQNSQVELALSLLEKAVEFDAGNAANQTLLAACHLSLEHHPQAITAFRSALHLDPGLHAAHKLMWTAIDGIGQLDRAMAILKTVLGEHWERTRAPAATEPKVRIEETTLCLVDCANHLLVEHALANCMRRCAFERVLWLTDRPVTLAGVDVEMIDPIRSAADYSRFLMKDLLRHIDTEYVLTAQWDGYVVNPDAWSPEFLLFDYVGARWDNPLNREKTHHNVGNGGFALRSHALLEALQDPTIKLLHPEDGMICRKYRSYLEDRHGIVFAPDDIADRFSFEHIEQAALPFGFHGVSNLAQFVAAPGWAALDFIPGV